MLRKLWSDLHQSYFVVFWCVGEIVGTVLALIFQIGYFSSPWWCVGSVLPLVGIYLKPKRILVVVAFMSGVVVAFFRASGGEGVIRAGAEDLVTQGRDFFAERIRALISEPEVSLGVAYLLGIKSGLPKALSENLRAVGLTHIVVASGAHLSILVEVARKVFGRISRFAGLFFSVLFILFFMAMVGWTPSIMRAGIMAILNLLAWYVGRKIAPWRLILMVAALTLVVNPGYIVNLGWLLSFASYTGIMMLGPALTKFFYGEKQPKMVASTIITTLAATIMTLPITLYYFGQVSLISVVANLLILPTLPYAMGLVFLAGVVAGVPWIETVVVFAATKLLDFHIAVVEFFGGMTQFLVKIEQYQPAVFLIYGGILILAGIWFCGKRRKHKQVMIK